MSNKQISVTYDDEQMFEYEQRLKKKGNAFDSVTDALRSWCKHGVYEFSEIKHKQDGDETWIEMESLKDWIWQQYKDECDE